MSSKESNLDTLCAVLHQVRKMKTDVDAIESLFEKRRGRNPHALQRMRATIDGITQMLGPVLIKEIGIDIEKKEAPNGQENNNG